MILTRETLSVEEVVKEVESPERGAIVTFSGCVRSTEGEKNIKSIVYDSYEVMADKELGKIIEEIKEQNQVSVSLKHRVGKVPVGEISLVVAVAGVHRKEAFNACEEIIGRVKARVPIWKVEFEE